ncbi:MAG: SMC-Scp complex subunit ScpB, partial [Eubacteriales bacterium]|nr:SMC-Scp complex subunit ScpB [Eubacteriales bacterium]
MNANEPVENGLDTEMDLSASIEALLFAAQDGLSLAELSQLLELDEEACQAAVETYAARLESEHRGLALRIVRKRYFLATRSEYNPLLQKLFEDSRLLRLTKAAYECLAVIAYNQPCTRAQVEAVRGVNSDSVI